MKSKKIKEVERAAIDFATKRYKAEGWEVKSVEADDEGYDLCCTRKGKEKPRKWTYQSFCKDYEVEASQYHCKLKK